MKIAALVTATLLLSAASAYGHCDSMDGPVVKAARAAIASGSPNAALVWVKPQYEDSIRVAFARTMRIRALDREAQEMADMYFFEALVRLHRTGEGEAYTGLKPAGYYKGAFTAADKALEKNELTELNMLPVLLTHRLVSLHTAAREAMNYAPGDIAAGRKYVEKYTQYMHFVEALSALAHEEEVEHAAYQ